MRKTVLFAAAAAILVLTGAGRTASLDKALLVKCPDLLDALKEEKVRTVGILPFRVKKGTRVAGFTSAPLATNLPGRLENALILTQGGHEKSAIRVIRDAAATGSKARVGSWTTTRAAFNRLFTLDYQPAWGSAAIKPDAFITGEVVNSADSRESTSVALELLKPGSWKDGRPAAVKLLTIKCGTDRALLRDLGYAYALSRSAVKARGVTSRALDQQALKQVKEEEDGLKPQPGPGTPTSHSARDVGGMRLEIEYDGVKQEVTAIAGDKGQRQPQYQVAAAKPGQKVVICLTRVAEDDTKLGVVLRVNGKSVLEEQDAPPEGCNRWIYAASKKGVREEYAGFYFREGDNLVERTFKVLTAEESAVKISEMGSRAGWIDLDVFAAGAPGGDKPDDPDGLTISTRSATKARGATLKEVQAKIAKANNIKLLSPMVTVKSRGGLIVLGAESANPSPYESSDLPNARAVGGISIRYYEKPASGTKVVD